jgi:hypothetical protein
MWATPGCGARPGRAPACATSDRRTRRGDRQLDHLALGPDGEIVEPTEYRERQRARAAALLATYE